MIVKRQKRKSGFLGDDKGATLVELTVVLPVVLSIGLGAIEFGNLYHKYHLMTNGVRDAARFAAGLAGDVCNDAALKLKVVQIAQKSGSDNGVWSSGSTVTVACTAHANTNNIYRGASTIHTVTVTATVPYQSLGFLGFFGLTSPTLTSRHQERVIGVR